jgi:hypothetical protein
MAKPRQAVIEVRGLKAVFSEKNLRWSSPEDGLADLLNMLMPDSFGPNIPDPLALAVMRVEDRYPGEVKVLSVSPKVVRKARPGEVY